MSRGNSWVRPLLLLAVLGLLAGGFVSWEMTGPARRLCRYWVSRNSGWQVALGEARWTPWRDLELRDFRVQTPLGARLRVETVRAWPRLWTLVRGRWESRLDFGEIRIDPDSWRIRSPRAREILSAKPAAAGGVALLGLDPERMTLQELGLEGPLVRLKARGWLAGRAHRARLSLWGELSGDLLEQPSSKRWESFDLEISGALSAPEVRFHSGFFTFAMNPQAERR